MEKYVKNTQRVKKAFHNTKTFFLKIQMRVNQKKGLYSKKHFDKLKNIFI